MIAKTATQAVCAILLMTVSAIAQDKPDLSPKAADRNKDGVLAPDELSAWEDKLKAVTGKDEFQAVAYLLQIDMARAKDGAGALMAVDRIKAAQLSNCALSTAPVLRDKVSGTDLLSCKALQASKNGASFSFARDSEANTESMTSKLGLGIPLKFGTGLVRREPGTVPKGWHLAEYATALYFEVDGSVSSDADNTGTTEAGLLFALAHEGGLFTQTITTAQLYARSDMDFDAEIIGGKARFTPINTKWSLGGVETSIDDDKETPLLYWTASADLEGFRVGDPGSLNFDADTEYLFAGVNLGVVYENLKIAQHGIKFTADVSHHVDLLGDIEATRGTATFDLYLDEKQTTSLKLTRSKGAAYAQNKDVDETSISYTYKF